LVKTGRGAPYEKSRKIMNAGTCAHEGELLRMKGKIVDFLLKTGRGYPTKKVGKS